MTTTVDLVVGVCAPERHRVAIHVGHPRARLDDDLSPSATRHAIEDFLAVCGSPHSVVDCPSAASAADLIELFREFADDPDAPDARLGSIVAVVDAAHLLDDLDREDYYQLDLEPGSAPQLVAWSLIAVTQIEYASVILVTGWRRLERARLEETISLLCHLNPRARVRLERRGWRESLQGMAQVAPHAPQPGWVEILNGRGSETEERRVRTLRYDRLRPFHPQRLVDALETTLPEVAAGKIVRSAGVCRFATRLDWPARWDQVGRIVSFDPFEDRERQSPQGQELALIGFGIDAPAIAGVLDSCLLTDEEFLAGPEVWNEFADPLPPWIASPH